MRIKEHLFLAPILLACVAQGQQLIDATGAIRQRTREATLSRGGGVGRKLAVQVALDLPPNVVDASGKSVVEFILTNDGKNFVLLPISPHPADFEPSNPEAYSVTTLGLRVSSSSKPGHILAGGADLFGSPNLPGTLAKLAPGESIRILARVLLPPADENYAERVAGSVTLGKENLQVVNGKLVSDSHDIGFARSQDYTMSSIPRDEP